MMALKLTTLLLLISASGFIDAVPPGYTSVTRAAYYRYSAEWATWAGAASSCRAEGARLFHPDSADELERVWRELAVDDSGFEFIHTGISDLGNRNEYVTVDGRPISQVFNKWAPGEPDTRGGTYLCGVLVASTHPLYVDYCDSLRHFICKHEEEVTATDVKTVTAASASHVAALEQQLANQARAWERIAEADANPAAALDRLTEALQRHAANQTAAVERQAPAMEKLAGPPEDNEQ